VALPIAKDFTAANGTALTTYDSNFQNNSGALAINTNSVHPNSAFNEIGVRWNGDSFNADQYSQATLAAKPASNSFFIGVGCRHAAAGTASYYLYYTANTETWFGKLVGGTFTAFGAVMGGRSVGEVLRIEAEGTTIRAKINGAQQRAQTDSALASGAAGLTGYEQSTTLRLDDWEAGNVTPDPTPTYVASGAAVFTATNGASLAPLPPARAAGDKLVLVQHYSATTDLSDTVTGWTKLASGTEDNTAMRVEVWWRDATNDANDNPTLAGIATTTVRGARIFAVRGAAAGAPTVARSNNAASATVTFPAATAASATTLSVLAYSYEDDPSAIGTVSGFGAFDVDVSALGTDMALGMDATRANTASGSQAGGTATVSGGTFANSVNTGLHFIFEPISTAYTGSGALTLPATTLAGSGTHTAPTYTGSGALTLPAATLTGSGTQTPPAYTATGALALPALSLAGDGAHTIPTYTGSGDLALPPLAVAGTGTQTPPGYSGSGDLTLPALTLTGAGDFSTTYTGSGDLALPAVALSGSGTHTIPTYDGAGDLAIPLPALAGDGTHTAPTYTGAGDLTLPATTLAGSGDFAAEVYSGTGALALPTLTLTGAGAYTMPAYTADGALTLPAPTVTGTGTHTAPVYTATGALALPVLTLDGTGALTPPAYTGTGTLTLPALAVAGTGVHAEYAGTGALALPALSLSGVAEYNAPPVDFATDARCRAAAVTLATATAAARTRARGRAAALVAALVTAHR
jgi:hypothetical protein